jgi:acyl-CoA synthetase (AMP-forming)/AMP-acid ligase II
MNLFDEIFKHDSLECTAILFEEQQISYAELREQTLLMASALATLGVKHGERVALLMNDSPEFVAAFIAICSYGAIAVPINMALRLDEQRAILNDSTAQTVIIEAELADNLPANAGVTLPQVRDFVVVDRNEGPQLSGEARRAWSQRREDAAAKVWSLA